MDRHESFNTGSTLCECADLFQGSSVMFLSSIGPVLLSQWWLVFHHTLCLIDSLGRCFSVQS